MHKTIVAAILASIGLTGAGLILAASHREAPGMAGDPTADITDVYAFVSYDQANLDRMPARRRATFIMNVIPGQNPADGPNYFNFGDDVVYRINIDNDRDGKADDVVYEFRFKTRNRPVGGRGGLTSPVPYLGNPHIPPAVPLQGITRLDGPGSEGLTRRQTYTVTEIRGHRRTELFNGQRLVAVPSNIGSATMPNYESLAAQGIYSGSCADGTPGVRVFAGQRAETFYIDLGAVFDTLNLRRYLPLLSPAEDVDNVNPFGINRFANTNVNTIAIEVPIRCITSDRKALGATANPVIGVYGSTSRQKVRVLERDGDVEHEGPLVQVSRMGNPLVNELIINTPQKDKWNATEPEDEAQFQGFYKNPVIATALELVYGVPVVPFNGSPPAVTATIQGEKARPEKNRPASVAPWTSAGLDRPGRGNTRAKWRKVTGMSAAVAQRTRTTMRITAGSPRLRRTPTSVPQTARAVANAANQRLTERRGLRASTSTARPTSISATAKRPRIGDGGMAW